MNVMEWTVGQIEKDSECCGNPFRCEWYHKTNRTVFANCSGCVEEEVLEK